MLYFGPTETRRHAISVFCVKHHDQLSGRPNCELAWQTEL